MLPNVKVNVHFCELTVNVTAHYVLLCYSIILMINFDV